MSIYKYGGLTLALACAQPQAAILTVGGNCTLYQSARSNAGGLERARQGAASLRW